MAAPAAAVDGFDAFLNATQPVVWRDGIERIAFASLRLTFWLL
jgi:hypothetical protein